MEYRAHESGAGPHESGTEAHERGAGLRFRVRHQALVASGAHLATAVGGGINAGFSISGFKVPASGEYTARFYSSHLDGVDVTVSLCPERHKDVSTAPLRDCSVYAETYHWDACFSEDPAIVVSGDEVNVRLGGRDWCPRPLDLVRALFVVDRLRQRIRHRVLEPVHRGLCHYLHTRLEALSVSCHSHPHATDYAQIMRIRISAYAQLCETLCA